MKDEEGLSPKDLADLNALFAQVPDTPMKDEVVNVYLASGAILPLRHYDATKVFNELVEYGYASVHDKRGTRIHMFAHGVEAVIGFSKEVVDDGPRTTVDGDD